MCLLPKQRTHIHSDNRNFRLLFCLPLSCRSKKKNQWFFFFLPNAALSRRTCFMLGWCWLRAQSTNYIRTKIQNPEAIEMYNYIGPSLMSDFMGEGENQLLNFHTCIVAHACIHLTLTYHDDVHHNFNITNKRYTSKDVFLWFLRS